VTYLRSLAWSACLWMAAGPGAPQTPSPIGEPPREFTIRALTPGSTSVMLEIDPSEAQLVRGSPAWQIATPSPETHQARFISTDPYAGERVAFLSGTAFVGDAQVSLLQQPDQALRPDVAYTVSVVMRGEVAALGEALLVVETRRGPSDAWRVLSSTPLAPSQIWRQVNAQFMVPREPTVTRMGVRLRGEGSLFVDEASLTAPDRPQANLLRDPGFEGSYSWRVRYRAEGEGRWVEDPAIIHESRFNVIGLRPRTTYEFSASLHASSGRRVGESGAVTAQTDERRPREWEGLSLQEPTRLRIPEGSFPSVQAYQGQLYLSYSLGGAIALTQLDASLKPISTRQIVPPFPVGDGHAVQGNLQSCLVGSRLYVSFKRDHAPFVTSARLCVVEVDLDSGTIRGPAVIESNRLGRSPWNGGIAAARDELWIGYADTRDEFGDRTADIVLRRFDPRVMEADSEEFRLGNAPSPYLYAPLLGSFGNYVALTFSDVAEESPTAAKAQIENEPLYVCLFDGRRFTDPVPIETKGRHRYGQMAQVGAKLLVAWKRGASYPAVEWGTYMFHDIGLALVDPIRGTVESTAYVEDLKYNAYPAMARLGDRIALIHTKHEHDYGIAGDPAEFLGLWGGWLEVGR